MERSIEGQVHNLSIPMARTLRILAANQVFHVINRGNDRQIIFDSPQAYLEYLALLEKYAKKFQIAIYHYVLMPNHIHMLVEPSASETLPKFMQGLTLAHTIRHHRRNGSCGHLWQGRYKNLLIQSDSYFLRCGQYIELNPVRANLVDHPSQYPWSSYSAYAEGRYNPILAKNQFFETLATTPKERQERYKMLLDEVQSQGPDPNRK